MDSEWTVNPPTPFSSDRSPKISQEGSFKPSGNRSDSAGPPVCPPTPFRSTESDESKNSKRNRFAKTPSNTFKTPENPRGHGSWTNPPICPPTPFKHNKGDGTKKAKQNSSTKLQDKILQSTSKPPEDPGGSGCLKTPLICPPPPFKPTEGSQQEKVPLDLSSKLPENAAYPETQTNSPIPCIDLCPQVPIKSNQGIKKGKIYERTLDHQIEKRSPKHNFKQDDVIIIDETQKDSGNWMNSPTSVSPPTPFRPQESHEKEQNTVHKDIVQPTILPQTHSKSQTKSTRVRRGHVAMTELSNVDSQILKQKILAKISQVRPDLIHRLKNLQLFKVSCQPKSIQPSSFNKPQG